MCTISSVDKILKASALCSYFLKFIWSECEFVPPFRAAPANSYGVSLGFLCINLRDDAISAPMLLVVNNDFHISKGRNPQLKLYCGLGISLY